MFVYNGQVTGHHGAGTALDEAERLFLIGGVQVIEKDSADTPSLPSVTDVEVLVTPVEQRKCCKNDLVCFLFDEIKYAKLVVDVSLKRYSNFFLLIVILFRFLSLNDNEAGKK